jgi:hypothetical protein
LTRSAQPARAATAPIIPSFRPDGTVMDLADVRSDDIDFAEMAAGLSKIARFNGRYRCPSYSVAQHSVMGADATFVESGNNALAACFLLHDGHEYLIGDTPIPAVNLFCRFLGHGLRNGGWPEDVATAAESALREAISAAKASIDRAIYRAAGLADYPRLLPAYERAVKRMDEQMLRAEGIALFGGQAAIHLPAGRLPAPRLVGAIEPWGPMKAEQAFLDRLARYTGLDVRPA